MDRVPYEIEHGASMTISTPTTAALNVADYIQPSDRRDDISPALQHACEALANGQTLLGTADTVQQCYPEMAADRYVFACNCGGWQTRCGLVIEDKEDVVIDGQGMTLNLRGAPVSGRGDVGAIEDPFMAVYARNCRRITLRNLVIDWQTPFVMQAVVVSSEPGRLVVEPQGDQKWWCWNGAWYLEGEGWTNQVRRLLAVDPKTGAMIPGLADNFSNGYEYNWTYSANDQGQIIIEAMDDSAQLPPVGSMVLGWVSGVGTSDREGTAVLFQNCDDVVVENVTIHHAYGMGIIGQGCNNVTVRDCVVEPSGERKFSLTADATHFIACRGKIELIGNRFQNQFDDAINVHGVYWEVVHQPAPTTIIVRYGHYQHRSMDFLQSGDDLAWYDGDSYREIATSRVKTCTAINSTRWN